MSNPSKEPVEDGVQEVPPKKESNRPFIGGAVVAILSLINIVLCANGTAGAWFVRRRFNAGDEVVTITLWRNETYINRVFRGQFTTTPADLPCEFHRMHWYGAEGAAIASTALALVGFIGGIMMIVNKKHRWLPILSSLFSIGSTMTVWAIAARLYGATFCGYFSLHDLNFDYAEGLGLFIGANVSSVICFFFAVLNPREPTEAFKVRGLNLFASIVSCIALILTIGATPVSWFRYKAAPSEVTLVNRDVTLWKTIYYNPSGATYVDHNKLPCEALHQYFIVIEAFAILGIAATAFASLFNWLNWAGKVSRVLSITVSSIATGVTLVAWAVGYNVFQDNRCSNIVPYLSGGFTLTDGFGLEVSAFAIMALAVIALGISIIKARREEGHPELSQIAAAFAFMMGVACLFAIVNGFSPLFSQGGVYGNGTGQSYYFWYRKTAFDGSTATYTAIEDVNCPRLTRAIKAAGVFDILTIATTFVAMILGITQTYNRNVRKGAIVIAFIGAGLSAIAWIIPVVMFTSNTCDNTGSFFQIAYGLGFQIATFCILIVMAIVNIIFG